MNKKFCIMRAYGHHPYVVEDGLKTIRAARKALKMWQNTIPSAPYYIAEVA